jgi:hypothetical protein
MKLFVVFFVALPWVVALTVALIVIQSIPATVRIAPTPAAAVVTAECLPATGPDKERWAVFLEWCRTSQAGTRDR